MNDVYNILIFGTGSTSAFLRKALKDTVTILAYVDNDNTKWGEKDNISVVNPLEISQFVYDYVVIASQFNEEIYKQLLCLGVEKEKILQYHNFINLLWNQYKFMINKFLNKEVCDTEVLVTGISYALTGFQANICCRPTHNLAIGSQDLFYGYHTVKYLLNNFPKQTASVKYVIIGLCYYSFQYDMSLSAMKGKTVLYYDILREAHYFKEIERVYSEYGISREIADRLFRKNGQGEYDLKWESPSLEKIGDKWTVGKKQAEQDCNKHYPETVEENIQILKEYITLLKNHNIKPVMIVFPASRFYTKYFSQRIENEFHAIMAQFKTAYDFQYLDFFRSLQMKDEDFGDVSHLNAQGAEKFTKVLNEAIEW